MSIEFDFSDVLRLEADLRSVPDRVNRNVAKAIEVTSRNVKDDWREGAAVGSGDGFSEAYSRSIFYDVNIQAGSIEGEIGPELGRPGGSAGFLEDSPGRVKAAPQHAGRDALRANEDDFVRGLLIAATEAVEK